MFALNYPKKYLPEESKVILFPNAYGARTLTRLTQLIERQYNFSKSHYKMSFLFTITT